MNIFEEIKQKNAFAKQHPRLFKRYKAERAALEKQSQDLLTKILKSKASAEEQSAYADLQPRIPELDRKMRGL